MLLNISQHVTFYFTCFLSFMVKLLRCSEVVTLHPNRMPSPFSGKHKHSTLCIDKQFLFYSQVAEIINYLDKFCS